MINKLICTECGEKFETDAELTVGEIPECTECGSKLYLPGKLFVDCEVCGFHAEGRHLECNTAIKCPECKSKLTVSDQVLESSEENKKPLNTSISPAEKELTSETESSSELKSDNLSSSQKNQNTESNNTLKLADKDGKSESQNQKASGVMKPGEYFGKYHIIDEIARGGMGIIYKVYDPKLQKELAMKVLIAGENASNDLLQRFMREARSAAQIKHPNIVPIHEVGEFESKYYFTMDLVEGTSFQEIIDGGWMSSEELLTHIRNIGLALVSAHSENIIHRDIKPANIMYDVKKKKAMLTDFGLAKDLDSNSMLSVSGIMMGSPAYMSPEQARGKVSSINYSTDIYSLGVVIYEAFTKQQPFTGKTIVDTVRKAVYDEPVPPRNLAPDRVDGKLQNIILKCMEKKPEDRYAEMQDLVFDLTAYLEGESIKAKGRSVFYRLWIKTRRHPFVLGNLIASPFIILISIFLFWQLYFAETFLDQTYESLKSNDIKRKVGALRELIVKMKENEFQTGNEKKYILKMTKFCLNSDNEELISEAVSLFKLIKSDESANELIRVFKNENLSGKIRIKALKNLVKFSDFIKQKKQKISELLSSVLHNSQESNNIKAACINFSVNVWTRSLEKKLINTAEKDKNDESLRIAALKALGKKINIQKIDMTNSIIKIYAKTSNTKIKKAAECALENSRNKNTILDIYGGFGLASTKKRVSGTLGKMQSAVAKKQRMTMQLMKDDNYSNKKTEKSTFSLIVEKLNSKNPKERLMAAFDLGETDEKKAVKPLIEVLNSSDSDLVYTASASLYKLGKKYELNFSRLLELLDSENTATRTAVLPLFALNSSQKINNIVLQHILKEKNMRVIAEAAELLKNFPPEKALPALDELLAKTENKSLNSSEACFKALSFFGKKAVPFLIKSLKSDNQNIKNMSRKALEKISGKKYGLDFDKWKKWSSDK